MKNPSEISLNPDTLRILAIRVEFQIDDDPRTTGTGQFNLYTSTETMIDSPPHDLVYFQNQLTALANYYHSVSNGKLILKSEVIPTVFTLPHEMGHYNPGTSEALVDQGLADLFHDAIMLSDAAGIVFSNYDCYIVFHAGVGRDIDLGFDPTPSDIPSAFISLDDLRQHLGNGAADYSGIPVEQNTHHIPEGLIAPETESQEGYEIGLLGTMTLMFGFQIGLPALWNTQTGRSGIGGWGLMDQGSGNYYGLIPAEPSAWSKVFMGWVEPVVVQTENHIVVGCSRTHHANQIYQIDINDHEYFLIESRMHDANGDGITRGWDRAGNEVIFQADGTITVGTPPGVIVAVEEYDYGLPGSGILIWHIDEDVIREHLAENRVNGDPERRGIDLEEADGAQDIGEAYGFVSGGAGSESGVLHDAWFMGNEIHQLVNHSNEVRFGPTTYPNSLSNSGANSHIIISHFSDIDTVMTFSVENDLAQSGFPQDFGQSGRPYPPLFGDLNGDGRLEVSVVTEAGQIYAYQSDGTKVISSQTMGYRITLSGDTLFYPVALFADIGEIVAASPVVGDIDLDGCDDIFVPTVSGTVAGYACVDGRVQKIWEWQDGSDPVSFLLFKAEQSVSGPQVVIGTQDGRLLAVGPGGDTIFQWDLAQGRIVGICEYERDHLVATTENGHIVQIDTYGQIQWDHSLNAESYTAPVSYWSRSITSPKALTVMTPEMGLFLDESGSEVSRYGVHMGTRPVSHGAMGDVDDDGFVEIVHTSGGKFWCFNHNGSLVDNFPFPQNDRAIILSSPVLGDVDGDDRVDVLAGSDSGLIEGYSMDGNPIEGFPLTTGGRTAGSPVLVDLDDDGDVEVMAVSDGGLLYVWDLPGGYNSDSVPWGSPFHDPAHTGLCDQNFDRQPALEAIMPSHLVYNYPNPTEGNFTTIRYRLEKRADVSIRIYDLAGELIGELVGPGEPQTENEVVWNLADVESGVYFCQVSAMGIAQDNVVTFKIAVVK